MKHTTVLLCTVAMMVLFFSSCSDRVDITEQNVYRDISILSSDEMRGRHAFSPEIQKAANFIKNEFSNIGLSPLPEEDSFLQTFSLYSVKPSESSIRINGMEQDDKHYFTLQSKELLEGTLNTFDLSYISKDESYRDRFKELRNDGKSSIVVVDQEHSKWFHKYRAYFNRSNYSLDLDSKSNDVFILDPGSIKSADIYSKVTIEDIELYNVAGMIEGQMKDEIVLFSAHYDHIGVITPSEGDSVANGANDNASGVAAVIELARHFSQDSKPYRSIYFVAFTAEESGGYGSRYFSSHTDPEEIVAMFNIEMIGKPAVEEPNTAWITGYEYSDFGEILTNSITDSSFIFYADPFLNQNLFYRSDNANLARLGVPAHTISTTPIDVDMDYHRVTDEVNTLNIRHTTNTIRAIAKAARGIISGEQTPSRIVAEEVIN